MEPHEKKSTSYDRYSPYLDILGGIAPRSSSQSIAIINVLEPSLQYSNSCEADSETDLTTLTLRLDFR